MIAGQSCLEKNQQALFLLLEFNIQEKKKYVEPVMHV